MLPGVISLAIAYLVTLLIRSSGFIGSSFDSEGLEPGNAVFELMIMAVIFVISFAVVDRLFVRFPKPAEKEGSDPGWTQLLMSKVDKSEKDK
jgi:hypothetical protein